MTDVETANAVGHPLEPLADAVGELEVTEQGRHAYIRVDAARRPEALGVVKAHGYTFYNFCGGVDWPDDGRFDVLDQVYDWRRNARITLRYAIPRDQPRIRTGVDVYGGANWYERETAELFGIVFVGHPNLSRLFLPDWQDGFPLRKDFVLRARVEKPWPGSFFEA